MEQETAVPSGRLAVGIKPSKLGEARFRGAVAAACLLGLATSAALTGCSGFFTAIKSGGGGTGTTTFVYAVNLGAAAAGGTLSEYSLASGVLTPLTGSPLALTYAPTCIAISPNNTSLYVGTAAGVFLYTINSDGTLTADATVAYSNPNNLVPQSMAVDATSAWLIIGYQASTNVDAVPLDPTTGVPSAAAVPFTLAGATVTASQVAISAANTNVVFAFGADGAAAVGFSATPNAKGSPWGTEVQIPLLNAGGADTGVSVDPTSTYLFVTEANKVATANGSLRMFALAKLNVETDYDTGVNPTAVMADLSGDYVYVANGGSGNTGNSITGYTITKTTSPVSLAPMALPFPTAQSPVALAEDSSKTYIFDVGNTTTPNLWMYAFDPATPLGGLDVKTTISTATASPTLTVGIAVSH